MSTTNPSPTLSVSIRRRIVIVLALALAREVIQPAAAPAADTGGVNTQHSTPDIQHPGELKTPEIVRLARERHQNPDTTLLDFRSHINTLVSVGLVTDRLAPARLIVAAELASELAWDRDEGLQARMLGQRYVTGIDTGERVQLGLDFGKPWFIATVPGDSIRVLGAIELPERAAVHPFSTEAAAYYEYEVGDTIVLSTPQRDLHLVEVRVTPTRGDEALVVGSLWVDSSTGDIAALQIRFVGKPLWDAELDDPEGAEWANRILSLSAFIEQGYWERRYWLPRRQEVQLNVDVPFFGDLAVPFVFTNTFGRYDVNTGEPIAWMSGEPPQIDREIETPGDVDVEIEIGDGRIDEDANETRIRTGSLDDVGWEIVRPPEDSLNAYAGWREPLEAPSEKLQLPDAEELERRARALDPQIVGRKLFVIGQVDRLPEFIRYNRVESLGLGFGFNAEIPRWPFWSVKGTIGFGIADTEFKGRLGLRYDAPRSELHIDGFSELHSAGTGLTDGKRAYRHFLRAFFLGRDDSDYYRASGGSVVAGKRWGDLRGRAGLAFEDHRSVSRNTDIALTGLWQDSVFPPNPPATDNTYVRGELAGTYFLGDWSRPTNRAELTLSVEAGTDTDTLDYVQPRLAIDGRFDIGSFAVSAMSGGAGWTAGTAPLQREWRLGGLETVRGYTHGTRRGDSFWTARLELSQQREILQRITPVIFGDLGWAGETRDWPGGGSSRDLLWSAGAGASFFNGVLRADLVFRESGSPWFELYFGGAL